MKITTEHCIYAIMKHYYETENENPLLLKFKLWKRISKSGKGDKIVRVFKNKETGTIVSVVSSETEIFKVIEDNLETLNIKSILRRGLEETDFYDLRYELFGVGNVVNWPIISMKDFIDDPDEQAFDEPLDLENFEWLSITDNELVIACGGDWQEPLTLTIKLINGKLTVTNKVDGYKEGMDEKTFMKNIK